MHIPTASPIPTTRFVNIFSMGVPITLSVLERHPQAVTVIFYPGTMATPHMYPLLLNALWHMGCNVVGIHPLSHGLSPKKLKVFTIEDILQNGLDAEIWAQQHFSGPLVACGHSQGGILALAHATQQTTRIAATFPIGTLLPQRQDAGSVTLFHNYMHYREQFLSALRTGARYIPRLPIPFLAYLSLKRILAGSQEPFAPRRQCRATYPLKFLYSLFSYDLSAATTPDTIQCPVILLTAKNDALFPLSMMQSTLDNICAPSKKLITLAGGGHLAAVSRTYAPSIAAHIAQECAGLGLPLYITK